MRSRLLGNTGISVTELSFGGASIGNLYRRTTSEAATAAVRQALALGIRYFDTAPHYGLGLSERRLGAALQDAPRHEIVVSTKVGRLIVPSENPRAVDDQGFAVPGDLRREWDFSRSGILRSLEQSLERLQMDYVDVAYLHDPDLSGIEHAAEHGAAALIQLRDEGLVRAVGIGSNSSAAVAELFRTSDIDVAMLAGRYSLLEQDAEAVFEAAGGRGLVVAGVFNSGILAKNRPDPDANYNYAPASNALLRQVETLAEVIEQYGSHLPNAAIAFPLRQPTVASVTLGMRTAHQVSQNVEMYTSPPDESSWADPRISAISGQERDDAG